MSKTTCVLCYHLKFLIHVQVHHPHLFKYCPKSPSGDDTTHDQAWDGRAVFYSVSLDAYPHCSHTLMTVSPVPLAFRFQTERLPSTLASKSRLTSTHAPSLWSFRTILHMLTLPECGSDTPIPFSDFTMRPFQQELILQLKTLYTLPPSYFLTALPTSHPYEPCFGQIWLLTFFK